MWGTIFTAVLILTITNVVQPCDIILQLSSEDRVVLINRVLEDYHTCLKCLNSNNEVDPTTQWEVFVDGSPLADQTAIEIFNGTLLLLFPTIVVPNDGRDVDVVANCYTADRSLNRNITLYSMTFIPPVVDGAMIEAERGETVTLSCTNNNPPGLATEILWTQNGEELESLELTEDSDADTVTYDVVHDESGVYQYQCEVRSSNDTVLVVGVTLTVGANAGAVQVQPQVLGMTVLYMIFLVFYFN